MQGITKIKSLEIVGIQDINIKIPDYVTSEELTLFINLIIESGYKVKLG